MAAAAVPLLPGDRRRDGHGAPRRHRVRLPARGPRPGPHDDRLLDDRRGGELVLVPRPGDQKVRGEDGADLAAVCSPGLTRLRAIAATA
ncbi:hypothetical protein DMP15_01240 [Pseudonocardia sp. UM4_GMWB1]